MEKPSTWPKQRNAFRDNYLAAIIAVAALLLSLSTAAQTLDTSRVRQGVFANPGYDYIGLGASRTLLLPRDTFPQAARDSGAISIKNGTIYRWTGNHHVPTGGTDNSIATGSRTATGDFTQNWNRKQLIFDTAKDVRIYSNAPDWNFTNNKQTFLFEHYNSVIGPPPLSLKWSLRDVTNSFDSVGGGIISDLYSTTISHYTGSQSGQLYLGEGTAQLAGYGAKTSTITAYNGTITLDAADSTMARLKPAATADSVVAVRSYSFGLNTLVKVPMPTGGGSADSTTFATNYRVDTAKANLRTQIAGKQATGNYITALTGDVTASGPGSVAATIANNAVTNAKAAQMAAHTFKGNNTGSTANASDLTPTQLTAELNVFGAGIKGLVPAAGGSPSSTKYLSEDGTFSTPAGGGGSQTLQQVFSTGSTITQHNKINNTGHRLTTTGQVINNGDTTTSGWVGSQLVYGTSIDAGYTHDAIKLISNHPQQTAGSLGLFNDNRALSGTTLIHNSPGDNCMQDLLPSIPNWDPSIRYIIIGTYPVNDVQTHDSTDYHNALSAMIDSLHLHRGYPLSAIIVLTGTPAPARSGTLALVAKAAFNTATNKGVRVFDSYTYLDTDHSNIDVDSLHLNIKGQYNLAWGLLNSGVYDTVNYTRANNLQAEQALSVNGKSYLYNGYYSNGDDSTKGNLAVDGNLSLYGNFVRNATFNSGIVVTGNSTVMDQRINLYKNAGQVYGLGVQTNSFGNYASIYSDDFNNDGIQGIRYNHTDGTTVTDTLFRVNNNYFKLFSQLQASTAALGTITVTDLDIAGANHIGREWNLFSNAGLKFGLRMDGSSPYALHLYAGYNVSGNYVGLEWMDSDGSTLHPILKAQKDGTVIIPGLATGGTAPATSGTIKMVVADANGQLSLRDTVAGGSISGSGTSGRIAYWNGSSSLTSNSTFLFNGSVFSVGTTNTQGQLNVGGNKDLSSSGAQSYYAPATYTDQATAASGTANQYSLNYIGIPTIAAANASVTFPTVWNVYIDKPAAGTNATIQKNYALGVNGPTKFYQSISRITATASSNITLNETHDIVRADATAGNISITLPSAGTYSGICYTIKRIDNSGNTVTIVGTIDNATNYSLSAVNKYVTVISDGSSWEIIGNN